MKNAILGFLAICALIGCNEGFQAAKVRTNPTQLTGSGTGGGPDPTTGSTTGGINPLHVGPGPLTEDRAAEVAMATFIEYSHLSHRTNTVEEKSAASEQLLLRTIWHLQLAGFQSGRQRNPSSLISKDKLTVNLNGIWEAYDLFMDWDVPDQETRPIFYYLGQGTHVPSGGIAD